MLMSNEKTDRMKFYLLVVFFICSQFISLSQDSLKRVSVEVVGSNFFNSERHAFENGEQGIYKEFRALYRINRYIEIGTFIGHQWRSYIYYKRDGFGDHPYFMDRQYIPAGLNLRVYITDIFSEKLNWIRQKEKWDVYTSIILARLFGSDKRDPRESSQDNIVYLHSYVREYGKVYFGVLLGLNHYPFKKVGFFLEGGEGAIAYLQIGARLKL